MFVFFLQFNRENLILNNWLEHLELSTSVADLKQGLFHNDTHLLIMLNQKNPEFSFLFLLELVTVTLLMLYWGRNSETRISDIFWFTIL